MAPHVHLKCYARKLSDCSRTISKEHYISHGILRAIWSSGPAITSGLAWQQKGAEQFIPTKGLASKVLCKEHNSRLSKLDFQATELFEHVRKFSMRDKIEVPKSTEMVVDGSMLERWMLKCICGFLASRSLPTRFPDRVRSQVPSDWWVDMLFGLSPIPFPFGLYFFAGRPPRTEVIVPRNIAFQFTPLEQADIGVYGAIFRLQSVTLLMSLAQPPAQLLGTVLEHATWHPPRITLTDGDFIHRFNFNWREKSHGRPVTITLHNLRNE